MKKILIIRLTALGDIIHTLPLANVLKKAYPQARIDWVVADKFQTIIENNPLVDNFYVMPLSKWRKNWLSPENIKEIKEFGQILKNQNYDLAIDAHQMLKSALVLAICGAKRKISYKDAGEFSFLAANELVEPKSKRPHRNYHVIKRHLDIAEYLGVDTSEIKAELPPSSNDDVIFVDELLKNTDYSKPIVILSPATTWESKHWLEESWAHVLNYLKDKANVIFTGTDKDAGLINKIIGFSNNKSAKIFAGKTNLKQLIELFRRADIIITPDSGSAHLAWAANRPCVITLFFATSSKTFAPIGEKHTALPHQTVCTACHKRNCKLLVNKYKCKCCINHIDVIECIDKLLTSKI